VRLRDQYLNRRRQVGLGRRNSVNRTRRGVGQRTRPFIELERTGRDSNPLDLSIVCHVLRTGSRVWFGDRRGGESETLRCSTIELRRRVNKWRRWDSNPQHPALQACTPIQQSVILWWRRRVVRVTRSQSERRLRNGCKRRRSESNHVLQSGSRRVLLPNEGLPRVALVSTVRIGKSPTVDWPLHLGEIPAPFTSRLPGIATLGPSCTPSSQLGLYCDRPTKG